jgi:hypothetical protein
MRTSNSSTLRQMPMVYIFRTSSLDRLTYIQMAQENDKSSADIFGMVPFRGIGGFGKSVHIVGNGTYDTVAGRSSKGKIGWVSIGALIPSVP